MLPSEITDGASGQAAWRKKDSWLHTGRVWPLSSAGALRAVFTAELEGHLVLVLNRLGMPVHHLRQCDTCQATHQSINAQSNTRSLHRTCDSIGATWRRDIYPARSSS